MERFLEKDNAIKMLRQAGNWLDTSAYVLALRIPLVHRWLWSAEYLHRLTAYCRDTYGELTLGGIRQFAAEANTQQIVNEVKRDFEGTLNAQDFFTPDELARLLGVTSRTVRLWMEFKTPLRTESREEAQKAGREIPCFTAQYLQHVLQWRLPEKP